MLRQAARFPFWFGLGLLIVLTTKPLCAAEEAWEIHGPWFADLTAIVADPSDERVLYVISQGGGVYRSADAGASWTFQSLNGGALLALAVAPASPSTLYAVSAQNFWHSADRGDTWERLRLPRAGVQALALHPQLENVIFVAVFDELLRSDDGGANWQSLARLGATARIRGIAISPSSPDRMWVATQSGVRQSTDGGATWSDAGAALQNQAVSALAVAPSDPSLVYCAAGANLYRSQDGGANWQSLGNLASGVRAIVIDPLNPNVVALATTDRGVLRTSNGGGVWLPDNVGLTDTHVAGVALAGPTLRRVALSQRSGVYLRQASAWQALPPVGATAAVRAVMFDPVDPARLLAGTDHGLYLSADAGQNWQYTYGSASHHFLHLAVSGPGSIGGRNRVFFAAMGDEGVGRSTDDGLTWRSSNMGFPPGLEVTRVAVRPGQSSTVFVGTAAGVWKTVNAGATWSQVALPDSTITDLAAAPDSRGRIVAGTATGALARSDDTGVTWQEVASPEATVGVTALAVDPMQSDIWYLGTATGVWRTADAGVTWTPVAEGLTGLPVRALQVQPANSGVYAATETGVFFLAEGITSWSPRSGGVALNEIHSLAISPFAAQSLLAGTANGAAIAAFPLDASGAGAGAAPEPPPGASGGGGNGGSLNEFCLAVLLLAGVHRGRWRRRFGNAG